MLGKDFREVEIGSPKDTWGSYLVDSSKLDGFSSVALPDWTSS